jgi:Protein similar to CwfJ C-terminus 1
MRILDLIQKTIDETPCPYTSIAFSDKQLTSSHQEKSSQYFYDMDQHDDHHHGKRRKMSRPPRQPFDQEKCWFCLSSQNVEKHLVISIGDNFYLALAKGPLNEDHVLILSITHIQCAAMLNADDWKELEKFKAALKRYFKSEC